MTVEGLIRGFKTCHFIICESLFSCKLCFSVYVDMVINHVCGIDGSSGTGSGGSYFDTSTLTFPDYSEQDFNCCDAFGEGNCADGATCYTSDCGIGDYNNEQEVSFKKK